MARYFHSLGLYMPCRIGTTQVLLFKSGLHLDYDGPATPIFDLMNELVAATKPKVFITKGTGGAIGADVKLGDVVIAGVTQFDFQTQFQGAAFSAWNTKAFRTSPVPAAALAAFQPALTS